MAWGAPPVANKSPSSLSNDQQFPSLGTEPSRSGRPIGGSSSVSHHAAAVPSEKIQKKMAFAETIPAGQGETKTNLGYHVTGSKKGGFPVTIEKRSCGKRVIVVRNVVGDSSALLSGLKKKLGCGGVISKDGTIEIQGERQSAVEKYLTEMNCLKSVSNAKKVAAAPAKKEGKVAEPTKIDKKMAELGGGKKASMLQARNFSITEQAAKKMKPTEIKVHLKAAGLSIQGNKKELLARLLEQIKR
mmetsp:Transcript_3256/g.4838  ORF Transcript_3256/g.4838 Transcript_3256/m.4838 type:complete len:244 (-) Transcript_3256:49-780(-)